MQIVYLKSNSNSDGMDSWQAPNKTQCALIKNSFGITGYVLSPYFDTLRELYCDDCMEVPYLEDKPMLFDIFQLKVSKFPYAITSAFIIERETDSCTIADMKKMCENLAEYLAEVRKCKFVESNQTDRENEC